MHRLHQVLPPAHTLCGLNGHAWVNFPFEGIGALEFAPSPELDCRQSEWQAFSRDRQAGVHQDAAQRGQSGASILVLSATRFYREFARTREAWRSTLMPVFSPPRKPAKVRAPDRLPAFKRFPKPDAILAQHTHDAARTGLGRLQTDGLSRRFIVGSRVRARREISLLPETRADTFLISENSWARSAISC